MCLHSILDTYTTPQGPRVAYKILSNDNETLFQGDFLSQEWQTAQRYPLRTEDFLPGQDGGGSERGENRIQYTSGFHCFATLKDAENAQTFCGTMARGNLVPVMVDEVTTLGIDGSSAKAEYIGAACLTIVANKCRLLSNDEKAALKASNV